MFNWKAIKKKYLKIHLVDKCLIFIMAILMLQSAYTLFAHMGSTQEVNAIDVVLRTSMAAIFGYFISANFTREYSSGQTEAKGTPPPAPPPAQEQGSFLYETPSLQQPNDEPIQAQPNLLEEEENNVRVQPVPQLQVLIVTAIGVGTLFMLIVYRDFSEHTMDAMGSLSQLRDFVSGCVGFLIGSGREDAP